MTFVLGARFESISRALTSPSVTVHRARTVTLAAPGITTWADGEPVAPLPATAECVPGALRVAGARRA